MTGNTNPDIRAVLTIDDIPSRNTAGIVDWLEERGIRALFFAWGEHLERDPEPAAYALRHGMIVGNHSWSHPDFSQLSLEECEEEIERCEAQLDRLYRETGVERRFRPFRFPYGNKGGENRAALQAYLRRRGFDKLRDTQVTAPFWKEQGLDRDIDTLWTFDFAEYRIRPGSSFTAEDVRKRMRDPAPETGMPLFAPGGRHILLLHAHDETEELAPGYHRLFLGELLERGVAFDPPEFL